MTVALRRMRWWDLDAVLPIEAAAFPDEPWSAEQWWAELARVPDARWYLVAEDEAGRVVGYAGLLLGLDEAEVPTMAVASDVQRRGTGRALLRALLAEADRRRLSQVLLEVRADNAAAQALYADEGFARIGVRRGYYAGGSVDALVLRRRAPRARVER